MACLKRMACVKTKMRCASLILLAIVLQSASFAQGKRKVIIDQDCAGPGGTDMQAILTLINSPDTDVLGITVLTGDAWRDEEIQHTLRLLEIIGRTDIPVVPGAAFPLVNSKEYIAKWEMLYGKVVYQGAWNYARGYPVHGPYDIPPMPEGAPSTKAAAEDAARFMVRMVQKYPHEVTIYAAGPMTDLAVALALDPHFAQLAKELIVMAGSINPHTDDPEFSLTPRREFNFWMDPEASRAVLHAHWPRIVLTTVDISVQTRMEKGLIAEVAKSSTPAAQYVAKYAEANYLWDELVPSHGSIPASSPGGRNFTLMSTPITALPTATLSPGPPASSLAWANNSWKFKKSWTRKNSTRNTWNF
jgi:purine nucleosidase